MDSGLWGPVFLSLIFWGFILGIVILPIYFRYRARQLVHETVRAMVAQGATIPPEMLDSLKGPIRDRDDERGMPIGDKATSIGIIVLSAGGGITLFGAILAGAMWYNHFYTGATMAGPIIVGAGMLVGTIGTGFLFIGARTRSQASRAD